MTYTQCTHLSNDIMATDNWRQLHLLPPSKAGCQWAIPVEVFALRDDEQESWENVGAGSEGEIAAMSESQLSVYRWEKKQDEHYLSIYPSVCLSGNLPFHSSLHPLVHYNLDVSGGRCFIIGMLELGRCSSIWTLEEDCDFYLDISPSWITVSPLKLRPRKISLECHNSSLSENVSVCCNCNFKDSRFKKTKRNTTWKRIFTEQPLWERSFLGVVRDYVAFVV